MISSAKAAAVALSRKLAIWVLPPALVNASLRQCCRESCKASPGPTTDVAHAQVIACAQHPSESLSAVTAELLHRHQSATSCCGRGSGGGVSKYLDSEELIRGANADATLLGGDLRASLGQPNFARYKGGGTREYPWKSARSSITAAKPQP